MFVFGGPSDNINIGGGDGIFGWGVGGGVGGGTTTGKIADVATISDADIGQVSKTINGLTKDEG